MVRVEFFPLMISVSLQRGFFELARCDEVGVFFSTITLWLNDLMEWGLSDSLVERRSEDGHMMARTAN